MGNEKSGLGSFLFGGIVGAAVGLLFAPQPGAQTRALLREKVQAYLDNADVINDSVRDRAVELYSVASGRATDASGQLKEKIDSARARLTETVNAAADSAAAAIAPLKGKGAQVKEEAQEGEETVEEDIAKADATA